MILFAVKKVFLCVTLNLVRFLTHQGASSRWFGDTVADTASWGAVGTQSVSGMTNRTGSTQAPGREAPWSPAAGHTRGQ